MIGLGGTLGDSWHTCKHYKVTKDLNPCCDTEEKLQDSGSKSVVRKIIQNCPACLKLTAIHQVMGRKESRPKSGIDLTGPFLMKMSLARMEVIPCRVVLTRIDPNLSEEVAGKKWLKRKCTQRPTRHITRISRTCKQTINYREPMSEDEDNIPLASLVLRKNNALKQNLTLNTRKRRSDERQKANSSSSDDEPLVKKKKPLEPRNSYVHHPMKEEYLLESIKSRKLVIHLTRLEEEKVVSLTTGEDTLQTPVEISNLKANNKRPRNKLRKDKLLKKSRTKKPKASGITDDKDLSKSDRNDISIQDEGVEHKSLNKENSGGEEQNSKEHTVPSVNDSDDEPLIKTVMRNGMAKENLESLDAGLKNKRLKKRAKKAAPMSNGLEAKDLEDKKSGFFLAEESMDEDKDNPTQASKNHTSSSKDKKLSERKDPPLNNEGDKQGDTSSERIDRSGDDVSEASGDEPPLSDEQMKSIFLSDSDSSMEVCNRGRHPPFRYSKSPLVVVIKLNPGLLTNGTLDLSSLPDMEEDSLYLP
ncbi:hypothetical protein LAZ67_19002688 [Cordylochernes scorpioides]|uniref:Uncharacterized protein n=1 Tax=Cordylochernes scorpioides TaxID=51811 RepID=A0ABY6LKY8_9ARAC|nr:hypothetical protein LAZ67_19002688 [Cordylochernes scorpioides]